MSLTIESISREMYLKCFATTPKCVYSYRQILSKFDVSELIVFNFTNYSATYTHFLMLALFEFWKAFNMEEWKILLLQLTNCHEIALADIIAFLYQYLKVDVVALVNHNEEFIVVRENVVNCVNKHPELRITVPLFCKTLDQFDVSENDLDAIRFHLYKIGFPQAAEKKPEIIRIGSRK